MGIIESVVLLITLLAGAFLAGRGVKWKTKKDVLDSIEEDRVDEYLKTREKLDERKSIDDVDAARDSLRKRKQRR